MRKSRNHLNNNPLSLGVPLNASAKMSTKGFSAFDMYVVRNMPTKLLDKALVPYESALTLPRNGAIWWIVFWSGSSFFQLVAEIFFGCLITPETSTRLCSSMLPIDCLSPSKRV